MTRLSTTSNYDPSYKALILRLFPVFPTFKLLLCISRLLALFAILEKLELPCVHWLGSLSCCAVDIISGLISLLGSTELG